MIKIRICIIMIIISALKTFAQEDNILNAKIDVFLDPTILESTEMKNVSFLDHIDISASQNLVIASNNAFYRIGYDDYAICKTSKEIFSFCFVENHFYYSNLNTLYEINDNGKERKVIDVDNTVQQMWGGKDVIYAVSSINEEYIIYAISPKTGKCVKVHTVQHHVLGISKLGPILYILHEGGLQTLFIKDKKYIDIPFNAEEKGHIVSMAIDKRKGCIYIASEKGIYRLYKEKIELVYNGTGFLCYDLDGLIIFNPKIPLLLRLRNETLYPNDSIRIKIR